MDYHLHTEYSADGEMSMEDVCIKALDMGIEEIAFTDHIDLDWPDPNLIFDIPNIELYIEEIEAYKQRFKNRLKIKTGIEIGLQPHILKETSEIVNNYPFDFVIGSIHIIEREDPYTGGYYEGKSKEDCYRVYYEEILRLINEFDDFDVLGHMGYIKRYSPFPYKIEDDLLSFNLIDEILKTLIKKGKGIEVNTSGYHHVSNSPMPPFKIIKRYKELGGTIITIGSDAHKLDNVGFGIKSGLEEIRKSGFNHITSFTARKPEHNMI